MPILLQINVTSNWGSTGKIAEGIGEAAISNGWKSLIAYGRYSNKSNSDVIKVSNMIDVYTHFAKQRIFDTEGLNSKKSTQKFVEQIKQIKPDIIHLHNIHDHWINYPVLFEYLSSINTPIVWTFHDCWAFTGGCMHFENHGCYKWQSACKECQFKFKLQKDNSERNYLLKKHYFGELKDRLTIVGVSDWISNYAKDSFLKQSNFITIHNGVNISKFIPGEKKENFILGVSSRWSDSKGLNDFYKLRKVIDKRIGIILIGLDKNQIKNLPEGIQGIEKTSSLDELIKYYQQAKVFINPTKDDTFPTVNIEALACGTPVLTYKTGGSPEAVDEKTGLVIEKGDIKGLSDSIKKIINGELSFDSQACRLRAETHFNQETQYNKYIDLYESLLSK